MDEELMEQTIENTVELELEEEIVETSAENTEEKVETKETLDFVEVGTVEEINIDMEEGVGWAGGDNTLHGNLAGRDQPDQHPIQSIIGLRNELDDIKALKTVYSDKLGVANYYEWNDSSYDEYGYFVSLVPHTTKIKTCNGNDIFGVTVRNAGFVGGQNNTPRDNKYALVVTSGLVEVRCESDVTEGDYVISNDRGEAEKTSSDCGYKVVGLETKEGTLYAVISLGVQACTTDALGKNISALGQRMGNAETNITAATNLANAAYNKAGESDKVSKEAVRKALEAMQKADDTSASVEDALRVVEQTNTTAAQARAIAESAATSAESMRNEAVQVAKDTLQEVNDLIEDLEPITTWEDPESGNTGAEYFTTYIKDGLATKVEVQTVDTMAKDNQFAILKNAESFQTLVSSIDKYSVGEYSQAYGLTTEQAKSILKEGMVYIPTVQHFEDTFASGEREFLRYASYEWDGEKWVEYTNSVSFSPIVPAGDSIIYWYIDSDDAPEGYEVHALYILVDSVWTKVNILAGNVNNRMTSMIRQEVDEVAIEIVNARGSGTSLSERLSDTDATIASNAFWKNDDGSQYVATFQQKADGDGSSLALIAHRVDISGETEEDKSVELKGASIVLGQDGEDSYISLDADHINFEANDFKLEAKYINLEGAVTISSLDSDVSDKLNNSITSTEITYALSNSATVAPESGWSVTAPEWQADKYMWQKTVITYTDSDKKPTITTTCIQGAKGSDGTGVAIKGTAYVKDVTVNDDIIGNKYPLYSDEQYATQITNSSEGDAYLVSGYLFVYSGNNEFTCSGKIQGETGVSVTRVTARYYISTSKEDIPDNDAEGWEESFDDVLETYYQNKKDNPNTTYYIWSQEKVTYSSGTSTYSEPTVNNANSAVVAWCVENDITQINGANIATGTLSASKITTGTLDASQVTVENLDASKITTGELDASQIDVTNLNASNITTGELDADLIDADELSAITADLGTVTAGIIQSGNYATTNGACTAGMKLSLSDATWDSENFTIDAYGNVTVTGDITAETITANRAGEIAGLYLSNKEIVYGAQYAYEKKIASSNNSLSLLVVEDKNTSEAIYSQISSVYADINELKSTDILCGSGNFTSTLKVGKLNINNSSTGSLVSVNSAGLLFGYQTGATGVNATVTVATGDVLRIDLSGTLATKKIVNITYKGFLSGWKNIDVTILAGQTSVSVDTGNGLSISNPYFTENGSSEIVLFNDSTATIASTSSLIPKTTGSYDLGLANYRWNTGYFNNVYNSTGLISSSDRNIKNSISILSNQDVYDNMYDLLVPVSYKFNDGTSGRTHTGLIAQDLKAAIESAGMTTKDMAAYCEWTDDAGNVGCGIRYEELISLNIYQIQKLKQRVAELEAKIDELTKQND